MNTALLLMILALIQGPDTLDKARAAAAPVTEAIAKAVAAAAALPPPASTREKLERMGRLDQAGRRHIGEIPFATLSVEESRAVGKLLGEAMDPVDHANMAELAKLIPTDGWFTKAEYGEAASSAAFHIVQHGADLETRKALLPRLKPLAERGEIDGVAYAALYDRTQTWEDRPQRYGTQFHCVDRKITPFPLEDPAAVEALRAALKLPLTYADEQRLHAGKPCG